MEKEKEFIEKYQALCKEYGMAIQPVLDLRVTKIVQPEEPKTETTTE